jgi:hypothetical protein
METTTKLEYFYSNRVYCSHKKHNGASLDDVFILSYIAFCALYAALLLTNQSKAAGVDCLICR